MQQFIHRQWQKRGLWAWALSPLSLLVCAVAAIKRKAYVVGLRKSHGCDAPVIVVGNLTVGGTGKTPMVIYLCDLLKAQGFHPGVISRGYKSNAANKPILVSQYNDASEVGDEPRLICERTQCPVMVSTNRVQSANTLVQSHGCNVIVSDDGFQHLKLKRDIDILVKDAQRGYGNGWCLPSGPLREGPLAKQDADFIVINGGKVVGEPSFNMQLILGQPYALQSKQKTQFDTLRHQSLRAIAAIGNPMRFFNALREQNLMITESPYDDHHVFTAADLESNKPIIMTEKDAVKCAQLPTTSEVWVVPVSAELSADFDAQLLSKLNTLAHNTSA